MPPRKKAADGAAAVPTRSSSRNKTPAPVADAKSAKPASKAPAKPKSKAKRTRDDDDDDDDEEEDAPAPKKKSKKSKNDDDEDDAPSKKPTSKKPTSKKPASKKPVSKKPTSKKAANAAADEDDEPPAKMVTVLKRGAAPVDPTSNKVSSHQVYTNSEGVWDAMLNQTDIGDNKNKFYALQLLHPLGSDANCILFTHWGRVGETGQSQTKGPFPSSAAIGEFKKQFKAKAGVNWEDRVGMVPKKGKYMWLDRTYGDEDEDMDDAAKGNGKGTQQEKPIPDSALPPQVQDFVKLIFSTAIMDATLSSMNYDARKLPLGKLSKNTILQGFSSLKTISEVIADPTGDVSKQHGSTLRAALETLSNAYYSIIPHEFGRIRPTVIDDEDKLKKELNLVDALGDMEIASKLISSSSALTDNDGNPLNPLDTQFNSLRLSEMQPLDRHGTEFKTLESYARDTHGATHGHIRANVRHIYRVERPGEEENWKKGGFDKLLDGERMLLWHGSRTTNFAGILQQGLRIAPPEAPVNGYMFGKGVYFADMMSKSAGYCYQHQSNNVGCLLLCEVAVKPFYEKDGADYNAAENCKSSGARATKGNGRTQPTQWKDAGKATGNDALIGCYMPDGGGSDIATGGYLQYNEYIVYDTSQIKVKYLFMVDM